MSNPNTSASGSDLWKGYGQDKADGQQTLGRFRWDWYQRAEYGAGRVRRPGTRTGPRHGHRQLTDTARPCP